jgi:hypothetical protein
MHGRFANAGDGSGAVGTSGSAGVPRSDGAGLAGARLGGSRDALILDASLSELEGTQGIDSGSSASDKGEGQGRARVSGAGPSSDWGRTVAGALLHGAAPPSSTAPALPHPTHSLHPRPRSRSRCS